jgi:hypothetical protein
MRPLLRSLLALALVAAFAGPAAAASIVTLALDPTQSSLVPASGPAETLSGTLVLRVGALPLGGSNTTFDVIGLAVTASGGATIGLDPDVLDPGLGVLRPDGAWLVPTLFVRITQGSSVDLAIPDLTGSVEFGPGAASITRLVTSFGIDTGAGGIITVNVVAVPEPGTLLLAATAVTTLALYARRARAEVSR